MTALFFKEWIKLRLIWGLILAGNAAFCLYLFLDMRQQFRIEHAEMLYYQASRIGRLFYADLQYVPALTGAALAVAQFAPEMAKGRLRLSMHLPISLDGLILIHLTIGLIGLGVILAFDLAALAATVGTFFPGAFVHSALATAAPWMLAGVAAYLGGVLVLLEPCRPLQVVNLAVAGGLVTLCHLSTRFNGADHALPGLALMVGLLLPAVLLPARRFRDGGR